jgi:hypothetical protein
MLLGRGHTILTSRELMRYYARSWDVIGVLAREPTRAPRDVSRVTEE